MLIINGTAEYMNENGTYKKGNRHKFNMFSFDMPMESQLTKIEDYLVSRGWDNIEIENNGLVDNEKDITHPVLVDAYNKALAEGFAVAINNNPVE